MKKDFIIWGLPLHSHTHSYVHHAFHRAALNMGYNAKWLENSESSNQHISEDSIILCCGIADDQLKVKKGANYILHNSSREDLRQEKHINLQVYTHDVLERDVQKLENNQIAFWENKTKTLYQPWATDLLPEEIDQLDPCNPFDATSVVWVGSVTNGDQGNYSELLEYNNLCKKSNIRFINSRNLSIEENILAIRNSRHAPTIQGKWQIEKGYIPCRLFKNISYGCWTETNSPTTAEMLELQTHNSLLEMFEACERFYKNPNLGLLENKMKIIKERHTYVSRLNNIISCLGI